MVNKKLIVFFTTILVVSLACSLSGGQAGAITVEISSPTEGAAFTVGQEVYVVASVIAENGVEKAYLSVNGQIVATEEPGVLPQAHVTNFLWVPIAEGNVKLSVVGTDGEGQSSEPVSVNVVIGAAPAGGDDPGGEPADNPPADTPEPPAATDTPEPPAATSEPSTDTPEPPTPTFTYTPHPPTPTFTPTPTTGLIISLAPIIVSILPQVETVWEQVSVPANDVASASVQCPSGSTVVGGGFATNKACMFILIPSIIMAGRLTGRTSIQ